MDSSHNIVYSSDSRFTESENESVSVRDIKKEKDVLKEASPEHGDVLESCSRKRTVSESDDDDVVFIGEFAPTKKRKKCRIDSIPPKKSNRSECDLSDYEKFHCEAISKSKQSGQSNAAKRSQDFPEEKLIQNEVQKLKCALYPVCELTFDSRTNLNRHLILDHDFSPYLCPIGDCRESFDKRSLIYKHVRLNHSEVTEWRCPTAYYCRTKVYTDFRKYYLHMVKYHENNQFRCPGLGCVYTATYRLQLHKHIAKVHQQHELF